MSSHVLYLDCESRVMATAPTEGEVWPVEASVSCTPLETPCVPHAHAHVSARANLRDGEHTLHRLQQALSARPDDATLERVLVRQQELVDRLRTALESAMCPQSLPAELGSNLVARLRAALDARGLLAVHTRLVDAHEIPIVQLQADPALTLLFPCWICLTELLRHPRDVERVLHFVRDRHSHEAQYRHLVRRHVAAPPMPLGSSDELDWAQNLPAWQWALLSVVAAWRRAFSPTWAELRDYVTTLGVPSPLDQLLLRAHTKKK